MSGINTYTWNAANQLATVNATAGVYTYNWLNQRSEKVTASATTYYVYGPGGMLYGEYDSSGTMLREYVYLNGAPLAQVDAGSPEVLTYLHPDHLGTPRYATSTSGAQVWSWNNDAFGTSTPSGSVTVNLRMPGQYFDAESGLFYNWNRYYNPAIGRYISSDPIGLAGGVNTFAYVGQNPVNMTDPRGEQYACQWPCTNINGSPEYALMQCYAHVPPSMNMSTDVCLAHYSPTPIYSWSLPMSRAAIECEAVSGKVCSVASLCAGEFKKPVFWGCQIVTTIGCPMVFPMDSKSKK